MNNVKQYTQYCAALTLVCVAPINQVEAAKDNRPNLVVIMCDDISSDMFGCYGNQRVSTPNIDRLAEQGVAFSSAWNSSISCPARAQIMTGKYATQTGFWYNNFYVPQEDGSQNLFEHHPAFSKILNDSGYATATAGKWNIGSAEGQDEPIVGFDEYCMWESQDEIRKQLGLKPWDGALEDTKRIARYWHPSIVRNGELVETTPEDFGPDIFTDFVCDFIDRSAQKETPFLVYYPMVLPHWPYVRTPLTTKQGDNSIKAFSSDQEELDSRFAEMTNYIDLLVGRIIETLERTDTIENTVIIFMADNGTAITAKSRGVERGCHIPLIVSGKGVLQRGMIHEICDSSDILPTLLEYAQTPYPTHKTSAPDGVSLVPLLSGEKDHHKEFIHACIGTTQMLRTREYLLEVYNPIMGVPEGRFYYCGDSSDGYGYVRAEGVKPHEKVRKRMMKMLRKKYIGLSADNPIFTGSGKKFFETYSTPQEQKKHLHDHEDYVRYDQSLN